MFGSVSSETHSSRRRLFTKSTVTEVVQGCPSLQEIGIEATIGSIRIPVVSLPINNPQVSHLSFLNRLILKLSNTYDH